MFLVLFKHAYEVLNHNLELHEQTPLPLSQQISVNIQRDNVQKNLVLKLFVYCDPCHVR